MFIKENEFVKNLHKKKTPGPGDFTGKLYQVFKNEIIQTIQMLQKINKRKHFFLFYKTIITLITKCDKDIVGGLGLRTMC